MHPKPEHKNARPSGAGAGPSPSGTPSFAQTRAPGCAEPPRDCPLCPRLVQFRSDWRAREPDWHNAPVPTWTPAEGEAAVRLLVIGMAPGLRGANRTGRPFTGDYAGTLLYETMIEFGFAAGRYAARPDDGLRLVDAAVTNAVRCVPPENKPTGPEATACRRFLAPQVSRFPSLAAILTLGAIAHQSTVRALGRRVADFPFAHARRAQAGAVALHASYHCSRYNTNTGVLTPAMFRNVFAAIRAELDASSP